MTKEILKELTDCRAAFEANPTAESAWCCHHEKLSELLTEPYENRIAYILSDKPEAEQAIRLRNFRPCSQHDVVLAIYAKYQAERDAVNAKWQADWDASYAKYQPEWVAIHAKYRAERDVVDAKQQAERNVVDAKYWAEWVAIYAKYQAERDAICIKYQAELMAYYKTDVPQGTWNGKSIFNEEVK